MAQGRAVPVGSTPSVASDGSGGQRPPDRRVLMGCAARNVRLGKGCDGDAGVRRIVHQGAWENAVDEDSFASGTGPLCVPAGVAVAGGAKEPRGADGEAREGDLKVPFPRTDRPVMTGCDSVPVMTNN